MFLPKSIKSHDHKNTTQKNKNTTNVYKKKNKNNHISLSCLWLNNKKTIYIKITISFIQHLKNKNAKKQKKLCKKM